MNIHVLGYGFDVNQLKEYTETLKELRYEHNVAILNKLQGHGVQIDYDGLRKEIQQITVTRLNFAKAIVQSGYSETVDEALAKYLRKGGFAFVEYNFPVFHEVASKIHETGGIVSLAHPIEYGLNREDTEQMIKECMGSGLDAIECIHSSQNMEYASWLMELVRTMVSCVMDVATDRENRFGITCIIRQRLVVFILVPKRRTFMIVPNVITCDAITSLYSLILI